MRDSKGRREDFWSEAGSQRSLLSSRDHNSYFSFNDSAPDARKGWASESMIESLFDDTKRGRNELQHIFYAEKKAKINILESATPLDT